MAGLEDAIAIKNRVEQHYLGLPGVTGIDVGYKVVGGVQTDEVSIRVHVEQKRATVPEGQAVPGEIDGVVTDVLERRYEPQVAREDVTVSMQADTTHYPTLQGGMSIGPSRTIGGYIHAGTLGAVVVDNVSGQHSALTNFHVACVDSTWQVGDRQVQPSRIDTGNPPGDEFGAIVRAMITSNVDGGLLSIDSGRANSAQIIDIGTVHGTKVATLGMAVRKRGRTTLLTYGSVDGVSASVNVDYGNGIGVKTLTNQISITTDTTRNPLFSDHGDSGSVIVDGTGDVVGLLFAGSGTSTVANPIAAVLSELNISMLVGKSVLKDIKESRKDSIKDRLKDVKEVRKDLIKDKEIRKELRKEQVFDGKQLKDIRDVVLVPVKPGDPVQGPIGGAGGTLDVRLAAIESQLASLANFIAGDERPDLSTTAFADEAELSPDEITGLRAELEQQVADAAAAKAEFDGPLS